VTPANSVRDAVAAYDERVKLLATTPNAVALALVAAAFIRALAETCASVSPWWSAMGLARHSFSHHRLGRSRKSA
jgi:hypothetical protein